MIEELKRCPLCGSHARTRFQKSQAACSDSECWLYKVWMPISEWNARPLEDNLRQQLEIAQARIKILEFHCRRIMRSYASKDGSLDYCIIEMATFIPPLPQPPEQEQG